MIWIAHKRATTADVFRAATMLWGISKNEITSKCRRDGLVKMRWIMFASLREQGVRLEQIGEAFGLDEKTVFYGIKQHNAQTCGEYIENFDALADLHNQLLRGYDPHSGTASGSYKDYPEDWYGRQHCPHMGGFSDYNKDTLSFN